MANNYKGKYIGGKEIYHCLGDPKQAALFFDNIYTHQFVFKERAASLEEKEKLNSMDFRNELTKKLLGGDVNSPYHGISHDEAVSINVDFDDLFQILLSCNDLLSDCYISLQNKQPYRNEQYRKNSSARIIEAIFRNIYPQEDIVLDDNIRKVFSLIENARQKFNKLNEQLGVSKRGLIFDKLSFQKVESCEKNDLAIALTGGRIIDTSMATWDQILEFRKKPEAKHKLRRFYLFLFENYDGKPADFIEDDILQRLYDFDEVRKEFGFKANTSNWELLINSKMMKTAFAGTIVSALIGDPIITSGAASYLVGSGVFEIAKVRLQMLRQRYDCQILENRNELAYVVYAKEEIQKDNNLSICMD